MPSPDSNLQLWTARVGDNSLKIEQDTIQLLSPSERQRLDALKTNNKKREFLLSRALMRQALSQLFDIPPSGWKFVFRPDSTPIISNLPNTTFVSLSHSNGLIVFATSIFPIGVDIELIKEKENILTLAEAFMSDKEINALKSDAQEEQCKNFYRIWCAKESYYKATPSKQGSIKFNSISILEYLEKNEIWTLIEYSMNHFIFSIVVKNKSIFIHMNNHELFGNDDNHYPVKSR